MYTLLTQRDVLSSVDFMGGPRMLALLSVAPMLAHRICEYAGLPPPDEEKSTRSAYVDEGRRKPIA